MAVLDTNVLLRYMTDDIPEQASRALAVLQEVESGTLTAFLPEGVLVETIQSLTSSDSYNLDRESVRRKLLGILQLSGIQMPNKRMYIRALEIFITYSRLSFVDSLCVAYAERSDDPTVITFDQGFRNLPDVTWRHP